MTSLSDTWKQLESAAGAGGTHNRLRIDRGGCCPVFAACEKPSNTKAIILEVPAHAVNTRLDTATTRGFDVQMLALSPGSGGKVDIIVKLIDSRYMDLFNVLAEDLLEHIGLARSHQEGVQTLFVRLNRWQLFMEQHQPGGLGREAQVGLYGELWFLREHLLRLADPDTAVSAWKGPEKANQDFQLSGVAVEVKCSTANPHQNISVSNLRQLDDTGLSALILFHLSLDSREGSGETLPEIIQSVRELSGPEGANARLILDEMLFTAGYLDAQATQYSRTGYFKREQSFFQVKEGFPRIIERDVPDGIGEVKYSISLASCIPFELDSATVHSLLGGKLKAHG